MQICILADFEKITKTNNLLYNQHRRNLQVHDVFFSNGAGLRKDWQQVWARVQVQLEPLIQDRAVVGFFLGDELFPGCVAPFPSLVSFSCARLAIMRENDCQLILLR